MMRVNLKNFLLELLASFLLDRAKRKFFSRRLSGLLPRRPRALTGLPRMKVDPSSRSHYD